MGVQMALGDIAVVDALIIVKKYARNAYPIRAGHTILAVGAWDVMAVLHTFRHILKEATFFA